MNTFMIAANAVLPFIIYISFGYGVRAMKVVAETFLRKLNSMVFRCFFPLLMFNNFCGMNLEESLKPSLLLLCVGGVILLTFVSWLFVHPLKTQSNRKGVIIQALMRSNAILFALPLAESVTGTEGYSLATVVVSIVVPLYNIIAVIVLTYYNGSRPSLRKLLLSIITNPLILGALAGTILVLLKIQLPSFIAKPVKAFADLTTPLSLFILGGTLHFSTIGGNARALVAVLLLKLIVIPAVLIGSTILLHFTGAERFVAFCVFGTPVAVSSFSMAANMGGDADLAGQYVAFSTLLSLFTIFGWIVLLQVLHLL